tara:strand:+ start:73 stop:564 length:492 start_codon:yes stop_codon:yes gene_type:complete
VPGPKGGRPRKPAALKRLHGTAKKGEAPAKTPNATGKAKVPVGLSAQARRIWKSLGPKLHELGLLTEVDASMFGTYCQAYGDWLELTRKLNKLGVGKIYQTTQGGYRQVIPEVGARNTAFQVMSKVGPRFGLDPSSRSGIVASSSEAPRDAAEEFLFRPKAIA